MLTITHARSGGKGGQNVNKVNTKVTAKFKPLEVNWLSEELAKNLVKLYPNKINTEGEFIVYSTAERTQSSNLRDVLEKIQRYVEEASFVEKERIATKSPEWVKEKVLEKKRRHSQKKNERREGKNSLRNYLD